jgi:inner membrane protein
VLAVAISDVSGLKSAASATIGTDTVPFDPSLGVAASNLSGIHVRLANAASLFPAASAPFEQFDFRFTLTLNGSSELSFAPVARETTVTLASDWPHPSFSGTYLPTERSIAADGFRARWQVPHLARSVPQAFALHDGGLERIAPYRFGAKFFLPLDFYGVITRAAKYGVMFLASAFMAVFMIELRSGRAVHPVQYFFVGFAMVFFYVLLLSFAEYLGFANAYLAASGATGGMLSIYVARAQESLVKGAVMFAVFLVLYGFLYLVLRLEDYALITGAVLGFILMTGVMFATLRVDWSGRANAAPPPVPATAD